MIEPIQKKLPIYVGPRSLDAEERQFVRLLAEHSDDRQVARHLHTHDFEIADRVEALREKMHLKSRADVVALHDPEIPAEPLTANPVKWKDRALSARQWRILDLIVSGYSDPVIGAAEKLFAAEVNREVRASYKKLGLEPKKGRLQFILAFAGTERLAEQKKLVRDLLLGGTPSIGAVALKLGITQPLVRHFADEISREESAISMPRRYRDQLENPGGPAAKPGRRTPQQKPQL